MARPILSELGAEILEDARIAISVTTGEAYSTKYQKCFQSLVDRRLLTPARTFGFILTELGEATLAEHKAYKAQRLSEEDRQERERVATLKAERLKEALESFGAMISRGMDSPYYEHEEELASSLLSKLTLTQLIDLTSICNTMLTEQ